MRLIKLKDDNMEEVVQRIISSTFRLIQESEKTDNSTEELLSKSWKSIQNIFDLMHQVSSTTEISEAYRRHFYNMQEMDREGTISIDEYLDFDSQEDL